MLRDNVRWGGVLGLEGGCFRGNAGVWTSIIDLGRTRVTLTLLLPKSVDSDPVR